MSNCSGLCTCEVSVLHPLRVFNIRIGWMHTCQQFLYPAHRTLSDFRAIHLEELAELFVQVVKLASECGLVKLGTVAVDGTKVKANASRHKAMSYERMCKAEVELKEQIKSLLEKAKATNQIIVAAELTQNAADSAELPVMLDAVKNNLQELPEQTLADAGYRGEAVLEELSIVDTDVTMALGREGRKNADINAEKYPHTAQMAEKLQTQAAQDLLEGKGRSCLPFIMSTYRG